VLGRSGEVGQLGHLGGVVLHRDLTRRVGEEIWTRSMKDADAAKICAKDKQR
jgi:hypothetical protein